jgi:deferrochelatase/peroxidase EfeB
MSDEPTASKFSRGRLFAVSAAVGSSLGLGQASAALAAPAHDAKHAAPHHTESDALFGPHQAGIVTPQQTATYFAALDLTATKREDVVALMQTWTAAAARLMSGQPVPATGGAYDATTPVGDSGEVVGLSPSRLTITFGFGAGLFVKDGADRYGLAAQRPAAFVDLPRFNGDQLIDAKTGGDLSVQACANDPQVAFHAVRQLARLAGTAAKIRWVQAGFLPPDGGKETPRNLLGFKDGTQKPTDAQTYVWVGDEATSSRAASGWRSSTGTR